MNIFLNPLDRIRYQLFNTTAPRYDDLIMPAFGPLAEELVDLAKLQADEDVLDLGMGTGAVTFPASQHAEQIVGMDYAPAMVRTTHTQAVADQAENIRLYQGDMHQLPHPSDYFDVAIASFGFNGIDPKRALPEVYRVLKSGGRLIFQEWGAVDEASQLVKAAVKQRKVKDAQGFLADLRLLGATPRAWDKLGDAEQISQFLQEIGFNEVNFTFDQTAIPIEPKTFYRYKTAWAPYQAELGAMSENERAATEAEVLTALESEINADGCFVWRPELLRMTAWKK